MLSFKWIIFLVIWSLETEILLYLNATYQQETNILVTRIARKHSNWQIILIFNSQINKLSKNKYDQHL